MLWYSHKSKWWLAPVTTSKDKKTKQIVEIFLRGRVLWRWWGAIVRSLFNPFCFLARLLATTHQEKKPQKRNEMAGGKKRWEEKKGTKRVKHGKEKVTQLTTCSSHVLESALWLYMIRGRCQVWKPRKQRKERHPVSKNKRNMEYAKGKWKSQINMAFGLESKRTVSKVQSA